MTNFKGVKMTAKNRTVVGVFPDRSQAQQAVAELKRVGFTDDQIGVVGRDGVQTRSAGGDDSGHSKAAEGAATGVAAGAGIGALWALGIAAGMLPAIGPVIAGGIFASILASAAGGAAVAGLVGALIGLGIPEEEARHYEGEVKSGRTLVTVKADGRYDEVRTLLQRFGGYDMRDSGAAGTAPAATAAMATGTARRAEGTETMRVHEEQLRATKTPVEAGEVRVRKEVVTEQQNLQVPVTREEVVVERRPARGKASASDIKPGEEVRIPVKEEQVRVEKEAVVTGEVAVGKRKVTETENVAGTVRKEEVRVEQTGDVKVRDKGTGIDRK